MTKRKGTNNMTTAQMQNVQTSRRRGRPATVFQPTIDQLANAVRVDVKHNQNTGMYDYYLNGVFGGSAQNVDYVRRRIMRGQINSLRMLSDNFKNAFKIRTVEIDGTVSTEIVMCNKK